MTTAFAAAPFSCLSSSCFTQSPSTSRCSRRLSSFSGTFLSRSIPYQTPHRQHVIPARSLSHPRMALADVAEKSLTVLVVGSGGREHALVDKISQSSYLKTLLCAPGNPGMRDVCECVGNVSAEDVDGIVSLAKGRAVDLVVVGPEIPLVNGLVDKLKEAGILAFGPSKEAAELEGSKIFSKCFFERHNIPTAEFAAFCDVEYAQRYARELGAPLVVKAAGLAAGKGVVLARDVDTAFITIDDMITNKRFGEAGEEVVIERLIEGEELSFFALVENGERATALPLASAQDHKKAYDGDEGPNTGGMGAYSPSPLCDDEMTKKIMDTVVLPTVRGMREEGYPFTGVLYCGLMVNRERNDFSVLEFNVRFGDPECQVLCARLKSDLLEVLYRAVKGQLGDEDFALEWSNDPAMVVVMATDGYPGTYNKGSVIKGIEKADNIKGVKVYHAGTALNESGDLVGDGGRVLGVTATGASIEDAQRVAYQGVDAIEWPQGFCRRDIGWRAIQTQVGDSSEADGVKAPSGSESVASA